jgi:hypothetical protein
MSDPRDEAAATAQGRALVAAVEELILNVRSASPDRAAELFRALPGRGGFVAERVPGWSDPRMWRPVSRTCS